jgi:hypothetical protein
MKQVILLLFNTVLLAFTLLMNGLAGSGVFNGKSVGDVSAQYDTLFAPAGYAFSIWGVIYLMLILFVGYQWFAWLKRKEDTELKQTGIWFGVSSIANGLWIVAWLNESLGISVLLILILLGSLILLTARLRLEIWDAPGRIIAFVWWPIVIYLGWIVVATVANIAAFLVSINFNAGFISASVWTIILITVAGFIYLFLVLYRNMREAALVGIWAFIAIAVRQWQIHDGIVVAAIAGAVILLAVISWHVYKNRKISLFEK